TWVSEAARQELESPRLNPLQTRRLEDGLAIPVEAQPSEIAERTVDVLPVSSSAIEIVEAKHHAPALASRLGPSERESEGVPEVKGTCGARCKAAYDGHGLRFVLASLPRIV